jgi:hypothetical protein
MEINDDSINRFIREKLEADNDRYPAGLKSADAIWQQIVARRQARQRRKVKVAWRVAACLLVLTVAGITWHLPLPVADAPALVLPYDVGSPQEHAALDYIMNICKGNNIACLSPAFRELENELAESAVQLAEVDKQIALFGGDNNLVKARQRIENHQARIIRAMVQIL